MIKKAVVAVNKYLHKNKTLGTNGLFNKKNPQEAWAIQQGYLWNMKLKTGVSARL